MKYEYVAMCRIAESEPWQPIIDSLWADQQPFRETWSRANEDVRNWREGFSMSSKYETGVFRRSVTEWSLVADFED